MSFSRIAKLDSHGESLFHKIVSYLIPIDINIKRRRERHLVSSLILTNRYWYKIIKSLYYCRLHLFEVISNGYDSLDFEKLIEHCTGKEFTRDVNFSKAQMFDDDMCLQLIQAAPFIESLSIGGCFNISDLSLKRMARSLKQLKAFNIKACTNNFSIRVVENFIRLRGKKLVSLNISKCKFVDDGLLRIIGEICENLKDLNVSSCKISDLSCTLLGKGKPKLTSLNISRNVEVSDTGLMAFLENGGSALTNLSIEGLDLLTPTGFMSISLQCKQMESLTLAECRGLDNASLHVLTQTLPKLKLLDLRYCSNITRQSIHQLCFVQDEDPVVLP